MEEKDFIELTDQWPNLAIAKLDDNYQSLIRSMQNIHDRRNVEDWENEFSKIAQNWNILIKYDPNSSILKVKL